MLRMQAALLLDKYQRGAHSCNGSQYNDAGKKSEDDIEDEETDYTTTYSTGGPIDVPTLKAHEHQRTLQSLEDRVLRTAFLIRVLHGLRSDTEEQRKSLGSSDEEDTGTNDHHDLLLENLLPNCKVLNINTPKKQKQPKETNWKQKFQKPQNENICLTYLNTENKRNFHFLSSG